MKLETFQVEVETCNSKGVEVMGMVVEETCSNKELELETFQVEVETCNNRVVEGMVKVVRR